MHKTSNLIHLLVYCESGVLLDDILRLIVPKGFFLPVVPGTKFITLGGAVAANIHGKNHHKAGSIAKYIRFLDVITEDGQETRCSATENPLLFANTIGGMGLTGIITAVCIQLITVETAYIKQKVQFFNHLEALAMQLIATDVLHDYTVAWIDGMSRKGRGVLLAGNDCKQAELPDKFNNQPLVTHNDRMLKVPPIPSSQLLNRIVLRTYNSWFYRSYSANKKTNILHYNSFFSTH